MIRLATSAIYVGANLIVSLLIVVLIVRTSTPSQGAQFFLFQAVFFPVNALISQFRMQLRFRQTALGRLDFLLDIAALVLGVLLLRMVGAGMISWPDTLLFALAIPLSYRGATALAGLQFDKTGVAHALVPMLTALVRLGVAFVLLPYGAPIAFLGGALAFATVPAVAALWSAAPATATAVPAQRAELFWLLAFFAITGFTFQWDRYLLSTLDLQSLIIISGVCMTWVLGPISTLFAVIYRADARQIFARDREAFDRRGFLRRAGLFCGAVLGYAALVAMLWTPLNAVAFPRVQASVALPLILIVGVMLDRVGLLFLYMSNAVANYRAAFIAKAVIMTAAICLSLFGPWDISLMLVFVTYALSALVFAVLMGAIRR